MRKTVSKVSEKCAHPVEPESLQDKQSKSAAAPRQLVPVLLRKPVKRGLRVAH